MVPRDPYCPPRSGCMAFHMELGRKVCSDGVGVHTGQVRYEKEAGPQASWQTTNQNPLESTPLSVLDKGLPQVSWDTSAAIIPLVNPVPCSRPGGFQAMRADHSRPPPFAVGKPGSGSKVAQPHQESCAMQRGSSI